MQKYKKAWAAINSLLEAGRSLSGNERHCVFLNTGGKRFACVSAATGLDLVDDGRALAVCDWNSDGKADLWISNRTAPWCRLMLNQSKTGYHFLALKLRGTTCNRDAIGARVEVHLGGESPRRLIKTLRAGEGFVAQSSKWLLFGLGDNVVVDKIVVRWPGGDEETLHVSAIDRFYTITQGKQHATRWTPPQSNLEPAAPKLPTSSEQARVFLATRLPFPTTRIDDFSGKKVQLQTEGGPVLLNLWASWCTPCVREMDEWTKAQQRIKEIGLRIVSVSIDNIDESEATRDEAWAILEKIEFPFERRLATQEFMTVMEVINRAMVDKPASLPLPTSLLLDARGRIAVIYKGPVDVEQLEADVKLLKANAGERFNLAAHMPGKWFSEPPQANPTRLVKGFVQAGELKRAGQYLRQFLNATPDKNATISEVSAQAFAALAAAMEEQNQSDEALRAYNDSLDQDASDGQVHAAKARLLAKSGRAQEAASSFRKAVDLNSDDFNIRKELVLSYFNLRQFSEAKPHLDVLVAAQPRDAVAHLLLGQALKRTGDPALAISHIRTSLEIQPDWPLAINDLAWMLATHPKESIRDGGEAIQLAEGLCVKTKYRRPTLLDTLAAAYAEGGRMDDAVSTMQKAIALLPAGATPPQEFLQRLELYQNGKPFREQLPSPE